MVKEGFKKWLINNDYTENTSVSYSNSIGRISENEGFDANDSYLKITSTY